MSLESFTSNPEQVKTVTNREGDGVGRSTSPQGLGSGNPAPYYEVSVKDKPGMGSDNRIIHSGPGTGTSSGAGTSSTDVQGFTSTTGNKVIIDSSFGADTITMQHHSGATIMIDADGSIHLFSTGKKGIGVISPKGDLTVFAKGHLILKGEGRVTVETDGDLDFNVNGNLGFHVNGDMHTVVRGSVDESIDGYKTTEVVKDSSTIIAGDSRLTIAGNGRIQSSGNFQLDVASTIDIRSDSSLTIQTQDFIKVLTKAFLSVDSKDKVTVTSTSDMKLQTQGIFNAISKGNFLIESKGSYESASTGYTKLSATGAVSLNTSSTLDVLASGAININGSTTSVQVSGSASVDTPSAAADAKDAAKAQYAPPNTIIDNLTSTRVAPDFPGNAKRMSANEFSRYKNEGGTPNPKAEAYAAGNKGAGVPIQVKEEGGNIEPVKMDTHDRPAGSVTSNGKSEQNTLPIPTSVLNSSQPISRHVKVGQIDGLRKVPQAQQKQVMQEAMNVAWNIIDPVIEKYQGRVTLSSWYRTNSANHITGGAVDLHATNHQDHQLTAEIAAYVRDNLPFDQCFLEKNDEGGIHCHVKAAPVGSSGGQSVLTCADPHCHSSTPGLQLSYAVAALKRAGGNVG
jgi:hypothetical protein